MLSRRLCAVALVATAVIHLAVVPEHNREWPAAAAFFVALAAAEIVLAVTVLLSDRRGLLVAGATVSVASGVLWVVSRTIGLPFGPEPFSPEPIAALDVTSTLLEVATAALFARLAVRARTLQAAFVTN